MSYKSDLFGYLIFGINVFAIDCDVSAVLADKMINSLYYGEGYRDGIK